MTVVLLFHFLSDRQQRKRELWGVLGQRSSGDKYTQGKKVNPKISIIGVLSRRRVN